MEDKPQTDLCTSMAEFEDMTLAILRGGGDPQRMKKVQRHLLGNCPYCRKHWTAENLLKCLEPRTEKAKAIKAGVEALMQKVEDLKIDN